MAEPAGDDAVRRQRGDVLAGEAHPPGAGAQQAGDGAQGRRLAGAVAADERDDRAGLDGEGDARERRDGAVGHVEIVDLEHAAQWCASEFW
jgi:hypothetical protein